MLSLPHFPLPCHSLLPSFLPSSFPFLLPSPFFSSNSIAEALDIPDYEDMKAIDLKHSVADWLEENREELKDTPMFKGLYGKRRGARAT